jgi:DNA-binding protein HU-beta
MPTKKQNRCWPGYEPVKGKKPNSQGSCRPKAESKLTDSEKEFRGKRKRQLKSWRANHPGTRRSAAQHLRAPGAKAKKSTTKTTRRQSAKKD